MEINRLNEETNSLQDEFMDCKEGNRILSLRLEDTLQELDSFEKEVMRLRDQEKMAKDLNKKMQSKMEVLQNEEIKNLNLLEDNLRQFQQKCKLQSSEIQRNRSLIEKQNTNLQELLDYQQKLLQLNKQLKNDNEDLRDIN